MSRFTLNKNHMGPGRISGGLIRIRASAPAPAAH